VRREIERAKQRLDLSADAPVKSCYEAGREGFWLHRWLVSEAIDNQVVDASSIEVNRRSRRAKTDRMDATRLLLLLVRFFGGERSVWSVVRVPSEEEEDRRHLHRELLTAKRDRTRVANRIQGMLANQGLRVEWRRPLAPQFDALRLWDGSPLPAGLRERLAREEERLALLGNQIDALESARRERIRAGSEAATLQVQQLLTLQGIGSNSAWLYVMEFFAWRRFRNRREVGALAGLTPTPYQSGESNREQGIAKAGNRHVRAMAIEIAWGWLRFQPESHLTRWYTAPALPIARTPAERQRIPNAESRSARRELHSEEAIPMLWTIFVILLVAWLLGMVSGYTMGNLIHILLVIAVIVLVVRLIQGRRVL
jgi:transposase